MENSNSEYALLIVLFNPSNKEISNIIDISNLFEGVIVDNTFKSVFKTAKVGKMRYVPLYENKGIAQAQNIGIKILQQECNFKYIIFFDQDSRFDIMYPQAIVNEYKRINGLLHSKLSCLGPIIIDKSDGEEYKSVFHKKPIENNGFIEKKEIISSGSCIALERFNEVGLFEEDFFIDFVDTEWCFRSRRLGLKCGLTPKLKLYHKVGKKKLHFGRHIILISAPRRYYYQYRNFIVLFFRNYVPASFKFYKGVKFFMRWLYFPFIKGGIARWINMSKGIKAGMNIIFNIK